MNVVGIDPGVSCGMVIVNNDGEILSSTIQTYPQGVIKTLKDWIVHKSNVNVVIENFIGSGQRSTASIYTMKLIGWCQCYCYVNDIYYKMQVPQIRVPFLSDAKKRMVNSEPIHIIDAYAHALAYIDKIKKEEEEE